LYFIFIAGMPGFSYIPTIMPAQAENRFYEFQAPTSLNGANGGLNGTNNLTRLY
jgi:hypothetical protein